MNDIFLAKMASTVELNITENCDLYDLYISSQLRRSMFVNVSTNDEKTSLKINTFGLMYKKNPDTYEDLLRSIKNTFEEQEMIFMGTSNDAFVGIMAGKIILKSVNQYLDSYRPGLKVRRIVLTDKLKQNDPPKCYPLLNGAGKMRKYKFPPNTTPPTDKLSWEPHISVYMVDSPEKNFYPNTKISLIAKTELDGKEITATI